MYQSGKYLSALEKEVMDLAIEDYTWLGDVLAILRVTMPRRSEEEQLRASQGLVSRLLRQGYVHLYYEDRAASTPNAHVAREIGPKEHRHVVYDAHNWAPYSADALGGFAIAATAEGQRAMFE